MNLSKGEAIEVMYKGKGWWFGSQGNKLGYFPINCATHTAPPQPKKGIAMETHPIYHSHSKGANRSPATPIPSAPSRVAKVLHSFQAQHEEDLTIIKGTSITVLDCRGVWWKAEYNGNVGRIPANYVSLL